MDEARKERLKRLDPSRIRPNGSYWVQNSEGQLVTVKLRDEDIRFLRWYYNDPNIAYNVQLPTVNKKPSANVSTGKPTNKTVRVSRDQEYTKPGYRLKEPIVAIGKKVVIFGLVICICTAAMIAILKPNGNVEPTPGGAYVTMTDIPGYTTGTSLMDSPTVPTVPETDEEYVKQVERAEYIRILCDVFQVDYQTTYSKLVEMTDNFSNPEYLAGRHPLVSCKGMAIDADSEEEFLIYAVRVIAQDPGRVDLTSSDVCIDNGYDSGTNYVEMIAKWARVLDVDPALVYGIMRAETGFKSELFINGNNPGGLKDGSSSSGFWIFPNKEAGIIELMMEIIKYQYKGANTIEEMAKIHCPIDDPEDTQGLNKNWVRNVTNGYEAGREIFEEMGYYESNGLSY